jgi:serine/threonine protein kinase/tetratricopeptide (TPR) repeat protein
MRIDPATWPTLSKLLDEWLDLPDSSRASWLAGLGPEYADVLPALRHLLAAQAEVNHDFLRTLPRFGDFTESSAGEFAAGLLIGPYRLISELGRGGMGVVWLAERADGSLKRPVALKLPIVSMRNAGLAERFARERDILAQLTHPHIARLYDAGIDAGGQPFLALEFVEGVPLTRYCDDHRLPVRQRIDLFLQALDAVQHAHRNLVVHRDLKPSNILVTEDAQVRLLDFGIAKMLLEGEAKETELTQAGGRALTPQYASPEQILGQSVTTASDVYSLGIVLYELLCGNQPYRLKRDSAVVLEEAILAADPVRPSQATITDAASQARSTTAGKLARTLAGDLDTIVLKALKKNPAERYATVDAFSQDIQRHLTGVPVLAQPESSWYRTRKFLLRNKLAVAAAMAIFVALLSGLGIAMWEARIASTEAKTAQAVQLFLADIFQANSIDQADPAKGRQTTAAELLDIGARKIDGALRDAPQAKLRVLEILGQMYDELELNEQAASVDRKRVQLARQVHGARDSSVAQALVRLAVALRTSPAVDERKRALEEATGILDRNRDFTSKTRARLLLELSNGYMDNDLPKASQLNEQAVKINQAYPPDRDAVSALIQQGVCHALRNEQEAAEESYLRALTALDAIRPATNHDRSQIYTYLGQAQRELQKFDAAEKSQRLAFQVAQEVGGADHQLTLIAQVELGRFLFDTSRTFEGLAIMTDAKERILKTRANDPQTVPWALNRYGRGLLQVGKTEEGIEALSNAEEILRKVRARSGYLATVLDLKATGLTELGRYQEARALLDEAADIHRTVHDEPIYVNDNLIARSQLLCASGRAAEAESVLQEFFTQNPSSGRISVTWVRGSLARAEVYLSTQKPVQAVELASAVRLAIERSPSRVYFRNYEARAALAEGKGKLSLHHPDDALPLLKQAVESSSDLYDREHSLELADAEIALAACLVNLKEQARPRALLAQAKAIGATHKQLGEPFLRSFRDLERRISTNAK